MLDLHVFIHGLIVFEYQICNAHYIHNIDSLVCTTGNHCIKSIIKCSFVYAAAVWTNYQ